MSFYIKRSNYWEYFFQQEDYRELFNSNEGGGIEKQKKLFNKFVNVINIETSAFCNRKCNYCPLSYLDRKQDYMKREVFDTILAELKDIGYSGHIALNIYNEPLLDVHLIEHIMEIRKQLPDVHIKFSSNGDYLSREKLDELIEAGLNSIIITIHAENFDEKHKENVESYIKELYLWEYIKKQAYTAGKNITFLLDYKGIEIIICANNWEVFGYDRGGTVEHLKAKDVRTLPCNSPIREITISYDGKIKPCCNIYFGQDTDLGTVMEDGILATYFYEKTLAFRTGLVKYGEKKLPCATCTIEDNSSIATYKLREEIGGEKSSN